MASFAAGGEGLPSSLPDTISRCLSLLKSAESDNERLASLLIVGEVMRSRDLDHSTRRKIFDAVGFDFINRLIATESNDSCEYHQLGFSILSSFCSDEDLAVHPQITSKIPHFNHFISSESTVDNLLNDSLYCINSICYTSKGRQLLWHHQSLLPLVKCHLLYHSPHDERSISIIFHLLSNIEGFDDYTEIISDGLMETFRYIGKELVILQDERKFKLCQLLADMLGIIGESLHQLNIDGNWLKDVGIALRDILQCKLDSTHRCTAYVLLGGVCQAMGCQWLLSIPLSSDPSIKQSSMLTFVADLMNIEVKIIMDNINECNQRLLTSCFSVLESIITLMAAGSQLIEDGKTSLITEAHLIQLHTIIMEAIATAIGYIMEMSVGGASNDWLLLPSVRLLGAWIAEDSLSLMSEVCQVMPYLLKMCREKTSDWEDILKFLMSGISQMMMADGKLRDVLIQNGFISATVEYCKSITAKYLFNSDMRLHQQVDMCLSVLLNTLMSTDDVTLHHDDQWNGWGSVVTDILQGKAFNSSIKVTSAAIYLMILKKHKGNTGLDAPHYNVIVTILGMMEDQLIRSGRLDGHDDDETSLLMCQELVALIGKHDILKTQLEKHPRVVKLFNNEKTWQSRHMGSLPTK